MSISTRSKIYFFLAVAGMSAPGCIFLPKPHVPKVKSAAEFRKVAAENHRFGMRYCGSNGKYHIFAQNRYYYNLGIPTTPSSIVKFYRVPREEIEIAGEFKRTWDMKQWKAPSEVFSPEEEARLKKLSTIGLEEAPPLPQ